jgi:RnfABCDGE-type electron transport complex B subunit
VETLGAALFLAALAGFLSVVLVVVARKFAVEGNPLVAEVEEALPQYNCGACGFPGCSGFARYLVETRSPDAKCTPGGPDLQKRLASILGMEVGESTPTVAHVFCRGTDKEALNEGEYFGIRDCVAADLVDCGTKVCPFGCLGLGSCAVACQFDAIRMEDGVAVIIEAECVACGQCVKACPRGLISMIPQGKRVLVECRTRDKGAQVKKYCKVGCITCQLCVKACPEQAIRLEGDFIVVDESKCTLCGACIQKCPQRTIHPLHWVFTPDKTTETTGEEASS